MVANPRVRRAHNESSNTSGILETLGEISEETAKISELNALEKKYTQELSAFLHESMKNMDKPISLRIDTVEKLGLKASRVFLTPQFELKVVLRSRKTVIVKLADISPEVFVSILTSMLPALKTMLASQAKGNESLLTRMVKELKTLLSDSK
ncbi:MAG: hypothetical protein HYY67_00730 [Thaumarchaeota archaeon]|nr:hypothetical protein [Nitrososphaerota archaeon]